MHAKPQFCKSLVPYPEVVKHARYASLQMAEVLVSKGWFQEILEGTPVSEISVNRIRVWCVCIYDDAMQSVSCLVSDIVSGED